MAKKESTFMNMLLTLLLATLTGAAAMGYVYELTKDAIVEAEAAKLNFAIKRVTPEFNNKPNEEVFAVANPSGGDSLYFYVAKMNDEVVGYAIKTYSKNAFGGMLKVLVGLQPDGTIKEVAVLEHKETPGLGTKMTEPKFASQFPGKNPSSFNLKVTKDGGEIDGITASTITSRAYGEAVQLAYDMLMKELNNQGGEK